jgi:threonine dehydrogenase-like Zn-dependent dehydrogenase
VVSNRDTSGNSVSNAGATRQFWIRSPGKGEIVTADLPPLGEDELLVRALYSGISRGTESLVFRGEVPESQRERMRAPFQEGDFPGPVKYGYSSVGEVLRAPDRFQRLVGRPVFSLFPHQDLYTVPASAVTPLPEDVPPARAVLAANLETAVNAVWDGAPSVGDRIVVVGAGVVGLLIAWLCRRIPGARVRVVDPDRSRAGPALELGLDLTAEPPEHADADLVVHASGTPEGLAAALSVAGMEATIVDVSWYGSRSVSLPLGEDFHSRRLTIRSSQVGSVPPARAPRWSHARRMEVALDLLKDPSLDALFSGESDFEGLPDLMAALAYDGRGVLCHRVRYRSR